MSTERSTWVAYNSYREERSFGLVAINCDMALSSCACTDHSGTKLVRSRPQFLISIPAQHHYKTSHWIRRSAQSFCLVQLQWTIYCVYDNMGGSRH